MGWCSGQTLLVEVWDVVGDYVHLNDARAEVLEKLVKLFESHDMDCWEAIEELPEGPKVLKKLHPDWNWDGEE
jgi:hypothetical protein